MAEWFKAHAWKVCIRETVSGVRIPLSPQNRSSHAIKAMRESDSPAGSLPGFRCHASLARTRLPPHRHLPSAPARVFPQKGTNPPHLSRQEYAPFVPPKYRATATVLKPRPSFGIMHILYYFRYCTDTYRILATTKHLKS